MSVYTYIRIVRVLYGYYTELLGLYTIVLGNVIAHAPYIPPGILKGRGVNGSVYLNLIKLANSINKLIQLKNVSNSIKNEKSNSTKKAVTRHWNKMAKAGV